MVRHQTVIQSVLYDVPVFADRIHVQILDAGVYPPAIYSLLPSHHSGLIVSDSLHVGSRDRNDTLVSDDLVVNDLDVSRCHSLL